MIKKEPKFPVGNALKRCAAMVEAGVADPTTQDGIDFCTEKCPYEDCIVFTGVSNFRVLGSAVE